MAGKTLCKLIAAVTLGICFLCQALLHNALAAPAPSAQQDFLAIDYRFAISRTTDAPEREALYLRMIDECPDTELAEEAY